MTAENVAAVTAARPAAGEGATSRVLVVALAVAVGLASAGYVAAGLLLHYGFRSYGWDLGIFDQVLWNTAHGHPFAYSFRNMSYLGDHFSPVLLLLAPLAWLKVGPAPLLAVQGVAFGVAAVPLFAAVRRLAGATAAWLLTAAYLLSLPVLRAVAYDFHPEAFVPLLAFTALWGLVAGRPAAFAVAVLALLTVKEDAVLLALALCWVAWAGFGRGRLGLGLAAVCVAYAAVVSLVLMPHFLGSEGNPLLERYGYLGSSGAGIAWGALTHPGALFDHLNRWAALEAVGLLLLGVGFLPLLQPRLWPPLAVLVLVPLLADHPEQSTLVLHYGVFPGAFAVVAAALALRSGALNGVASEVGRRWPAFAGAARNAVLLAAAGACAMSIVLFAWKSPLPPSFAAEADRFWPGDHAGVAQSFVDMVPERIPVSAQATYVPHLSQRRHVYEFPRVQEATIVILDSGRPVPAYDEPHFAACERSLSSLGFRLVREEDGVTFWQRTDASAPELDSACE